MRAYWPSEDAATGSGLTWVAATIVVAAVAIIAALVGGTTRFRWSRVDATFLLLILLVGLSTTVADDRRGAINLAWEWAGLGLVFLLVRNLPRTRGESAVLAGALSATAVAVAVYGIYQATVELPAVRREFLANTSKILQQMNIAPGTPAEAMFRDRVLGSKEPFSTFALANSLAGFLVGPLALGLAVAADNLRRVGRGSRIVAYGAAALPAFGLLLCLLLTKSRSASAGLAVACLVIAWRSVGTLSGRTIALAAGGLAIVVAVLAAGLAGLGQLDRQVVTESTKSLRYRLEYWRGAWAVITNAPIPFATSGSGPIQVGEETPTAWPEAHAFWRGLGPGNFAGPYLRHKLPESSEEILDPHNAVLEVWCTAGLPAAIALLVALGLGLREALRRGDGQEDGAPALATKPDGRTGADAPPVSPGWLIPWGAGAWVAVVALDKLNPFAIGGLAADLLARWLVLGSAWIATVALGWLLWTRRPIPAAGAGVGVLAIAINLLAAGGIGIPSVALPLWVLLALALNLRDDLRCGTLREASGIAPVALVALAWAAVVGAFAGAVVPFWLSQVAEARGQEAMARRPPAFEIARAEYLRAAEADKANVRPWLDIAELEYANWRSPESRMRGELKERVFLALNKAIEAPWRDPNSLAVRRLQAQYARLILQAMPEAATVLEILAVKTKLVRSLRKAAVLYPTNPPLRAQLAQASADVGMFGDAVVEAEQALALSALTPHLDKRLPDEVARDLRAKIPSWVERRDSPPPKPTAKP